MRWRAWALVLLVCMSGAFGISAEDAEKATVTDIVQSPSHYKGRTVQVRAQFAPALPGKTVSLADFDFGKKLGSSSTCLMARINGGDLSFSTGFGTFTGRVVLDNAKPMLLVRGVSDSYNIKYLNGPMPRNLLRCENGGAARRSR